MDYLMTFLFAVFSSLALFLIAKLVGCRQMSQLSLFDYVNGITIGSIAAELALAEKENFVQCLIALIVYGLVTVAFSIVTDKSIKMRRLLVGKSLLLYRKGTFYKEAFKRAKLEVNEFFMNLRALGYFNMEEIFCVYLEPNGKISVMPMNLFHPATPSDLKIQVEAENPSANVIIDGKIMEGNLKSIGKDRPWIESRLKKEKKKAGEIFLATATSDGKLFLYECGKLKPENMFE